MMKKFLLVVCGSFVGVWLALAVFFVTAFLYAFALIGLSMSQGPGKFNEHSVLHIKLSGAISERGGNANFDLSSLLRGAPVGGQGLNIMIESIKSAKDDSRIDGIFIDCEAVSASPATLQCLRRTIADFKTSGKFVYAYAGEGYGQSEYYVASVADSIFLNPVGAVDLHGLAISTAYPKKLLDKAGVEMQVVRVGSFKSAVEPYIAEEMSPENRLQQEEYLGNIWNCMAQDIAKSRKISVEKVNSLADSILLSMPADSLVKNKIVDKLCYRHEMDERLRMVTGAAKGDKSKLIEPVVVVGNLTAQVSGSKIAVLYAEGEIDNMADSFTSSGIRSEKICKTIYELIDDEDVKGLVLRVNSPGGSAYGSEQIWKAVQDFKASGKPVAVSMGGYAASGGYYISCGADRIFAEPTTITGSIGIFGMIPCVQQLMEDKLGVKNYVVKTNENADMGMIEKQLTPVQLAAMQNIVNQGYELFTRRCAEGRHMKQDSIKLIAEGRVWDGATAKKIGLVDELGGIREAIKWMAAKVGVEESAWQAYPASRNGIMEMIDRYMVSQYEARMSKEMGILYEYHKYLNMLLNRDHILCIMPNSLIK